MFNWVDLFFPVGFCLGAVALCMFVLFKRAKSNPQRFVLIVSAIFFIIPVIGLYSLRYEAWKCTYVTFRGIRVTQGVVNKCSQTDIARGEEKLIKFWGQWYDVNTIYSIFY